MKNHRLIRAFLKQPVDKTPIWLMRQAGRYLPEYRQLRKQIPDFLTLCKTPELACQATLQPLERFNLDGAIIFSDILTIPDAMGLGLHFVENEGPKFSHPLRSHRDITNLPIPDPESELRYVCDTLRLVKKSLNDTLPVIGFSGSPWTLAAYMLEGQSSDNFVLAKKMLYETPKTMRTLLEKLSESITLYLNAQIRAGADAVMIFDTWGGLLTTQDYCDFSLYYIKQIISNLNQSVPIIVFTKHGGQWIEHIATSGCNVIGLDWTTSLKKAKTILEKINPTIALQGNLDPALLLTSPMAIEHSVKIILEEYGKSPGHVFNLGHGILQQTPVENVKALVDCVHRLSGMYHG
jgi:uroporphyrinogen decarboxylase